MLLKMLSPPSLFFSGLLLLQMSSAVPSSVNLAEPLLVRHETNMTSNSTQLKSCNTPTNRACWVEGYNITTDYELETPLTGVTRNVSPVVLPVNSPQLIYCLE